MSDSLTEVLGAPPPAGIGALPEQQQRVLTDMLHRARRGQAAALAKAGDDSLQYIPAPLRGAVRKAVGL